MLLTSHRMRRVSAIRRTYRRRRGFVLPPVFIATVCIALLAGTMQFSAWRAAQVGRLAWNGQRALHAADEVVARTLADWDPSAFSASAIGSRQTRRIQSLTGVDVDVTVVRTQPLGGWIEADAWSATNGAHRTARRRIARAVLLSAPPLPIVGALTALAAMQFEAGGNVTGFDDASVRDECGPTRDTAAVAGVASVLRVNMMSAVVRGAPAERLLVDSSARAQLEAAWVTVVQRAQNTDAAALRRHVATATPWSAIVVSTPGVVLLDGAWRHEGLLAIDGDLVVRGTLTVRGMLIVHGALDTRAGVLDVEGAVLVADRRRAGSVLGNTTTVRYSQCALRRALAAVSIPSTVPFAVWQER